MTASRGKRAVFWLITVLVPPLLLLGALEAGLRIARGRRAPETEDELQRVFQPFFTRRKGGTGLGLSIAQRVVEQHGGRIRARNGEPGGAVLVMDLPLAAEAAPAENGGR